MPKQTQPDAEMLQFMADLEQSLKEAKAGTYARVHTPEMILAKRRGRPVGSSKRPVTLRVDSLALDRLRATGKGWQTRASEALSRFAMSGMNTAAVA